MSDELARLDATAQAELVRKGEIRPAELLEASINRIDRLNTDLNAVVTPLFEKAQEAAESGALPGGPFRGVPMLMKDIGAMTEGDRYCAGMRVLKRAGFRAPYDSFITAKLRAAGFLFVGKANTPELGLMPTTEPAAFGSTRNPYAKDRTAGGSSGGSAAAVAAGMVPIAHGNDGAGSIRIPASCCGLVGLKPSRGRTSLGPAKAALPGIMLVEHVVTRSVRDTASLLDVLAGQMPGDPCPAPPPARPFAEELGADPGKLKIGTTSRFLTPQGEVQTAHADCTDAVEHAVKLLESLGHKVKEKRIEALENPDYMPRFISLWAAGAHADVEEWGKVLGKEITADEVEPLTWGLREMGRKMSAADYLHAWDWLLANQRKVATFWQSFDLLLTPTVAEPPPTLGTFDSSLSDPMRGVFRGATFAPFTAPWNMSGQPAISLPLHRNADGLPIGVQLVAPYGREDLLLRVAAQLEREQPFQHLPEPPKRRGARS